MNNRAKAHEFMQHLAGLRDGEELEIGDVYDAFNGWRVYIRVGEKGISYDPNGARKWADKFEEMAGRPEWAAQRNWAFENAKALRACARSVTIKNRDRVVPEGYAEAMPTSGNA